MLVVRSDNCQNQYSADLLFFQMKKLAIELGIKIIWLYGDLVDGLGLPTPCCLLVGNHNLDLKSSPMILGLKVQNKWENFLEIIFRVMVVRNIF